MESISNAELLELAAITFSELETQFQYWLSVTFALLVACFVAKKQLSSNVRITIGILYTVSTGIVIFRFYSIGANGLMLIDELSVRGIQWRGFNYWVGTSRVVLMALGTLSTLWFLYSTVRPEVENGANGT